MGLKSALVVALPAFTFGTMGLEGMHLATGGLLQIHPSFVGDGLTLFPGHAFGHDPTDLLHLTPELRKELYYSQEGHRPAVHGAKHGNLNGNSELADPVDLLSNPIALENFASDSNLEIPTDDNIDDELGFTSEDGEILDYPNATAVNGTSVVKAVVTVVEVIVKVAKIIVNVAIISVKLLLVPFGVPFDHAYHEDFKFRYYLQSEPNTVPKIFNYTNGYEIWGEKGQYSFQCAQCGVNADFNVDGRLAFSIKDGITEGKVAFVNKDSFNIDAVFGLKLEEGFDKPIKGYEKQIAAFPLSPLTIPGIITLGPEVSISGTIDLSIQGNAKIALGGQFAISPGTASLSLVKEKDNQIQGLDVQFTPVAKFDGRIQATLELGLPIALECGLDVLNGKFKQTVALINKPSVYGIAKFSNEIGAACKNGLELRLGAQNKVWANAFKKWDFDIKTFNLYEKGIGCVTLDGFNTNNVGNTTGIINDVVQKLKTNPNKKPTINDVAATLKPPPRDFGFRVIMNEAKEAIMVSGNDGYIYLASNDQRYDSSAPVGSVNLTSNLFNMDVYARIMAYKADGLKGYAAQVRFWNVSKIPEDEKAAFLNVLDNTDKKDAIYYGLMLKEKKVDIYFPTFCKTASGTRLYATEFAIDKDGNIVDNEGKRGDQPDLIKGLQNFGVQDPKRNCGTVRLTSSLSGK
ncbi:hypothetical protein GQ53DRAFT_760879 [Thozetella sp. PMI_491]|nr:hypothetical protein GQ53DRAFT_760879 [Thozetella sp. PMI_491]